MTDLADRRRSVTRGDFLEAAEPGGVWVWQVMDPGATLSPSQSLPLHGQRARDNLLCSTLDLEDMWAAAIGKAVSKIAVRGWEVSDSDDSTRRTEKGQSLVRNLDGPAEYLRGVSKLVQDFLLTDNGWFVEVERESKSPGSRPRALYHLDSLRCWRTGNLDYPVVYWDYEGRFHKLRADQVIFGSDMPSARSRMFSKGRCAASRAFQTIVKLSAMHVYFTEKITGSRALALHFVSGLSGKQLQQAMETSEAEKVRRGHVVYKGAVMVPIEGDQTINVASIDLAGVADGFSVEQVEKSGHRLYALAIGLNPDELVERAAGLNSGASAQVAEDAAEQAGGLPYFVRDFENKLNFLVMPKTTTFVVKTNDIRDQEQREKVQNLKADKLVKLLGSPQAPGVIRPEMALQIAVDEGLVPREFLPEDVTPQGVLTDSGDQSKPVEGVRVAPFALVPPPAPAPAVVAKEANE